MRCATSPGRWPGCGPMRACSCWTTTAARWRPRTAACTRCAAGARARLSPDAPLFRSGENGRTQATPDGRVHAVRGRPLGGGPGTAMFLGVQEGEGWFAQRAATVSAAMLDAAPERIDLRRAAARWPPLESTAFAQARAVLHWHARHRYRGACGGALGYVRG